MRPRWEMEAGRVPRSCRVSAAPALARVFPARSQRQTTRLRSTHGELCDSDARAIDIDLVVSDKLAFNDAAEPFRQLRAVPERISGQQTVNGGRRSCESVAVGCRQPCGGKLPFRSWCGFDREAAHTGSPARILSSSSWTLAS